MNILLWCCVLMIVPYASGIKRNIIDIKFKYNNTYKFNTSYDIVLNEYEEYILEFAGGQQAYDTPGRVIVASNDTNRTYPLFVTARQQKGVFSWQLPVIVQTPQTLVEFNSIARTLCPHNNPYDEDEERCDVFTRLTKNIPIVHLSTSNPSNVTVRIRVETVEDFYVKLNETTNVTVSPSRPMYYFYPFKQDPAGGVDIQQIKKKSQCKQDLSSVELFKIKDYMSTRLKPSGKPKTNDGLQKINLDKSNLDIFPTLDTPKSVIIDITSDDDYCALVSIQNFSCPVFDNERDILYDGYYLTMTRRGGITLNQDAFPIGFYIVFIVKSSDEDCATPSAVSNATVRVELGPVEAWKSRDVMEVVAVTNDGREKKFRFTITETITYKDYTVAAGGALALFLCFYIAFILIVIFNGTRKCMTNSECTTDSGRSDASHLGGSDTTNSVNTGSNTIVTPPPPPPTGLLVQISVEGSSRDLAEPNPGRARKQSSSSDSDSEYSNLGDAIDKKIAQPPSDRKLCVANLSRKRARVISYRSKMYLWNVLIVTVFYTLPVIQLVVTYQRMLNQSGNQDLCYFNFLCAHPLMMLSDFNHVYSNIGYVMLGILFLIQVWRRHQQYKQKTPAQKELGIPQHFGLLYAQGVALVSEGVLSAAYHVCPNNMNFQFDTSFMYVTSVLCMVKIYQNRHPDINARAHATFGVLALIIFIGLIGVLNANTAFWILFTVLHILTCLIMTIKIYYMGRFRLEGAAVGRAAQQLMRRPLATIKPMYCGRMVLLFIANVANWAIAAYGVSQRKRDFASHLLIILMSNLFLYTLFYIVMKLLNKEKIRWYSWVFIALTYGFWFFSGYFYLQPNTDWSLTPAESRQNNKLCALLQLYDFHDIWHFLSAIAMFFSFNMYLTIDDNLSQRPRNEIMVF